MSALTLAAAAWAAMAAGAAPVPAPFEVAVATSPENALHNIRGLTSRLFELQKAGDRAGYQAARLELLEAVALLQDWAVRAKEPGDATPAFTHRLTAAGRKALGSRKPGAGDFEPRPELRRAYSTGELKFERK